MHRLDLSQPVRPPAATIRSRQHETARKPDQHVKVRTAGLMSLADPDEATRDAATFEPLTHAVTEGSNVTDSGRSLGPVRESDHQTTKPEATQQSVDLEQPSRRHDGTTHATKTGTVRIATEPDTCRINSTGANRGGRPTC